MADVSKIKLPDNSVVNIKDARITGVDTTPTSGSTNVVTSGGVYSALPSALTANEIQDIWNAIFVSVTLISFTINGTTYQAEEGMTWREWTESEYNTERYVCDGLMVLSPAPGAPSVDDVKATDVIVDGRAYTHDTSGGGSND